MTTSDIQLVLTTTDGRRHHGYLDGATDGAETEIKCRDLAGTLTPVGEFLEGKVIQRIEVQVTDGSILTTLKYYAKTGQATHTFYGGERPIAGDLTLNAFGQDAARNIDIRGLAIKVEKGAVLKVNCAD